MAKDLADNSLLIASLTGMVSGGAVYDALTTPLAKRLLTFIDDPREGPTSSSSRCCWVAAHFLSLCLNGRRPSRGWTLAVLSAGILSLPVGYAGAMQRGAQLSWLAETPVRVGAHALLGQYFLSSRAPTHGLTLICAILLLALTSALGVAALRASRNSNRMSRALAVLVPWAILPTVILAAVSVWQPVYQERYLTFCAPAVALLLGLGLGALSRRPVVTAACGLGLVLAATPILLAQKAVDSKGQENYRALADFLGSPSRHFEGVVIADPGGWGVLITYPARTGHVTVLNPAGSALATDRLFPPVRLPSAHVPAPRAGSNIAFLSLNDESQHPHRYPAWRRWLARHGCRQFDQLHEARFTIRAYHC